MVNQILEKLVNEVDYWETVQHLFSEKPYDSLTRKQLGQKIFTQAPYNFPEDVAQTQFSAIAADTVDNEIKKYDRIAKDNWVIYAHANLDAVLSEFGTDKLYEYSLNFNNEYQKLKNVRNKDERNAVLSAKYRDALTAYSMANGNFAERLHESALKVERIIHIKNLSTLNPETHALELDKAKETAYVKNGISALDDNYKAGAYIKLAEAYKN